MGFPDWLADQRYTGDRRLDVIIGDAKLAARCGEVFRDGKYVQPEEFGGAVGEFERLLGEDPRYAAVGELRERFKEES